MAPAQLVKEARTRARLSQTELARRSGVAQSVISAYESGRRQPSLRVLQRLVAATGGRLVLDLAPGPVAGLPDTPLGRRLRQRRKRVLDIAERYGVTNVRVFGSVARGEDTETSDVDLLVDLPPHIGLFALGALQRELSDALAAPVDLVPADGLKAYLRDDVLREGVAL
ncbi:MAG TPA: nucleotidyltransferase domain-containing protein [Frankiaceae bacterium]|nr:nucleotidyltransferase domain-containing protein [Frankiaceae bacterium]